MATISGINYKKIVVSNALGETYDLLPFDQTFGTPLAEMIIEVDTTIGVCTLNLPNIADFNGFWGTKITIIAVTGATNDVNILPFVQAVPFIANSIGGNSSLVLTANGQVAELNIATEGNWFGIATI
jgi:hypothetical protein